MLMKFCEGVGHGSH